MTTRIAVTGFGRSGKTVFLTSLLWHLLEYKTNSNVFELDKTKFKKFRKTPGWDSDADDPKTDKIFPLEQYRESFGSGKWPCKTSDCSFYSLDYTREKSRIKLWQNLKKHRHIQFMDFPGERLADLKIWRYKNYSAWSQNLLREDLNRGSYEEFGQEYKEVCRKYCGDEIAQMPQTPPSEEQAEALEKELLRTYKIWLANLCLHYKSIISPSSFLVDTKGKLLFSQCNFQTMNESEKILACSQYAVVGTNGVSEFCPVPNEILSRFPLLCKKFSRNYSEYRKKVIKPLFDELNRANALAVLVDIPELLASGSDKFIEQREALTSLLDNLHRHFWQKKKRVAIVATKADIVGEKNHNHLTKLIRSILGEFDFYDRELEKKLFICTAHKSVTKSEQKSDKLIGRSDPNSKDKSEFTIPDIPEQWPNSWRKGDFSFPTHIFPPIQEHKTCPPIQKNLNTIFKYLMGMN